MAYDQEKVSAFEDVITRETDEKIKQYQEDLKVYEQLEVEKTKNLEYEKMFTYMQAQVHQIQSKYKQMLTKEKLSSRRELLSFRNGLTDKVFELAEEKLSAFSKTEEYQAYFLQELKKAMEELPDDDSRKRAEILVKKDDLALEEKVKKLFGEEVIMTGDKKNRLGGFVLRDNEKGLLIDKTFASALLDRRPEFYGTCGLKVNF